MDEQNTSENHWKAKFVSEFSMGQFDFVRIDTTLKAVDECAAMVTSVDYPSLDLMQRYLAHLKNLYDNFKPIMAYKPVQDELDKKIELAKKMKRRWETSTRSGINYSPLQILAFVDLLDDLKRRLYEIKQVIGLGIIVKRNMTTKEKIKQGVRGNRDFDNLPEA
jgi:hypothetical protein